MKREEFEEGIKFVEEIKSPSVEELMKLEDAYIARYGISRERYKEQQKFVSVEEMSELTKEIMKSFRGDTDRIAILEEMADVEIMLRNLLWVYDISEDELNRAITIKLNRYQNC